MEAFTGKMPNIYNALVVRGRDSVCYECYKGLKREWEVIDTELLIVPVGEDLGEFSTCLESRLIILGPVDLAQHLSIHRFACFIRLDQNYLFLKTGIKVNRL
ncbi:hypothetical protein DVH24_034787 [Malus domestica]|uniref:Uncharacterized protein n=1 Tax=Malus domestica TaxID=3750 RepID=A0A498KPZ0_MALDO|nr:hypothetical protein DVH24_034787 [Malus domestica]